MISSRNSRLLACTQYPHTINQPYDCMQFIHWAGKRKFLVNGINKNNFFDFNVLLTKKKKNTKSENKM